MYAIAQQELGEQGMGLCMPVTLDAVYRVKKGILLIACRTLGVRMQYNV